MAKIMIASAMKSQIMALAALFTFTGPDNPTALAQGSIQASPPTDEEWVQMREVRQAGLKNDRSAISRAERWMESPRTEYLRWAAMRAASRLGARSVLPALDRIVSTGNPESETRDLAKVMRVRLLIESEAPTDGTAESRATWRLNRFLQELRVTVADLANAPNIQEVIRRSGSHAPTSGILFALRELADMAYQRSDVALGALLQANGIRFDADKPSRVKITLTPMGRAERINWLIDHLANLTVTLDDDYYLFQLAADFGPAASAAAIAKLERMRADRDKYTASSGFGALFKVILGVGDRDRGAFVANFQGDLDPGVRHYAEIVGPDIQKGVPRTYRVAY